MSRTNNTTIKLRVVVLLCSLLTLAGCKPKLSVAVSDSPADESGMKSVSVLQGESAFIRWQAEATQWAPLDGVSIAPDIGEVATTGTLEISDISHSAEYTVTAHSRSPHHQAIRIHALKPYCEGHDQKTGAPYRVGLEVVSPDTAATAAAPLPAVVIVHGGSFSQGDMIELAAYADEAVRRGYVAVNINYRLLPTEGETPDYSWPGALQDVKCAVRYVRAHAQELNIDVNNIGIMGHSAGGYLATMTALTGQGDTPAYDDQGQYQGVDDSVKALVSIAAPLDMLDTWQHLRGKLLLDPEYLLIKKTLDASYNLIFRQMGLLDDGTLNEADRSHPGYVPATPYTYIHDNARGNLGRPMMLIYGEADYAIPPANGCRFMAALAESAARHQVQPKTIMRRYPGPQASHIAFIPPLQDGLVETLSNYGRLLEQTLQDSFDFFDVYLKGESEQLLPESSSCDQV